jgi:DNA-binding transcriptional LysR family regulator
MNIDIGNLRAFCVVAEKESFTLAAELLGATQSTISMRVKKLEQLLGNKLFDSSPHGVELTNFGTDFIPKAKDLLGAHDNTLHSITQQSEKQSFRLGVTYHGIDQNLPELLRILSEKLPQYRMSVSVLSSEELYAGLARLKLDAIVAKRLTGDHKGQSLFNGKLVWMASKDFEYEPDKPVPLVSLGSPCSLRQMAINSLNAAKIPWQEVFIGSNVFAVKAAISAGLGIACLEQRTLPADCKVLPEKIGLSPLPSTEFVLEATSSARKQDACMIDAITEYFEAQEG